MLIKRFYRQLKDTNGNLINVPIYFSTSANYIDETEEKRFITKAEVNKLKNIEDNANNYTHPSGDGYLHIPANGNVGQVVKSDGLGGVVWATDIDTTYEVATKTRNGLMSTEHVNSLNNKADKSKTVSVTMLATAWMGDGPYINTLTVAGITASNNVEVILRNSATDEQVEAWMNCCVMTATQTTDTITLKAYGDKPEINIPLTIIIRAD